jgi:hypothetical protein
VCFLLSFYFFFSSINGLYNDRAIDTRTDRCSKEEICMEQQTAELMDMAFDLEKGERFVLSFVFSSRKLYTQNFNYIDK